ncbi:poly(ADP-ribose) glycohydrolase 1-like isoform X2 [Impatiens glandulifera]|uniref:poly(ADP-ribose) glycohydrolase 1-like isoform X2 n=1 Tax=Impatiens glandulifera TaxID=253017 RepID=UPI001FB11CF9|nr:poly(ADP-ribose) glycohydrolase 1-like isoform X2 [Impatiens glandulifera]
MEDREDLKSILPYLPLSLCSSSLFWPNQVVETLTSLSRGPSHSGVTSGYKLFQVISDLRRAISLTLPFDILDFSAADGYALLFDEAEKWMGQVIPAMADLLLRLPSLLEAHYRNTDVLTGLRLLESQNSGIVFLSQELIGAFLGCSFFCLFPISDRFDKQLQMINFDHLFANLSSSYRENLENKVKCIMHYFERICSSMPTGMVSFERKVLPLEPNPGVCYPEIDDWRNSRLPLCKFQAYHSGLIEDQSHGALEVDFANEYLGGGALRRGCVQEEIRFMINPELIIGMLFLPRMADNEAIEVVGAERFSDYTGYASTFRFSGDYVDKKDLDVMGRIKTRIIAIDALCFPGTRQFRHECLLREVNKAFCGFKDGFNYQQYQRHCQEDRVCTPSLHKDVDGSNVGTSSDVQMDEASRIPSVFSQERSKDSKASADGIKGNQYLESDEPIGIATGNWGCGAFGGDPELKVAIQWLAASQAKRPFILYHTFGLRELKNINQVCTWIHSNGWTVGELWGVVVDYSSKRLNGKTKDGFFSWLLPSLPSNA